MIRFRSPNSRREVTEPNGLLIGRLQPLGRQEGRDKVEVADHRLVKAG